MSIGRRLENGVGARCEKVSVTKSSFFSTKFFSTKVLHSNMNFFIFRFLESLYFGLADDINILTFVVGGAGLLLNVLTYIQAYGAGERAVLRRLVQSGPMPADLHAAQFDVMTGSNICLNLFVFLAKISEIKDLLAGILADPSPSTSSTTSISSFIPLRSFFAGLKPRATVIPAPGPAPASPPDVVPSTSTLPETSSQQSKGTELLDRATKLKNLRKMFELVQCAKENYGKGELILSMGHAKVRISCLSHHLNSNFECRALFCSFYPDGGELLCPDERNGVTAFMQRCVFKKKTGV